MNRIAILMTCYNRVQTTLGCLRMLFAQKLPEGCAIDVWMVDDASPDGTGERVRTEFPQVHVIKSEGELFWCKGMRLAWDEAVKGDDYDFLLWLNDDVKLKVGAIAGLLVDYAQTGGVIVGTFSSDERESDVSYGATGDRPDGAPRIGDKGMNGNLVLIPRDIYEKVGPICGSYSHQYGDYDYGWQVRKHGFQYYASSQFCGVCPQQPERYFHLKSRSLKERVKLLFNPKGFCLYDAFLYKYRNWGLVRGIMSIFHITVKVVLAQD